MLGADLRVLCWMGWALAKVRTTSREKKTKKTATPVPQPTGQRPGDAGVDGSILLEAAPSAQVQLK